LLDRVSRASSDSRFYTCSDEIVDSVLLNQYIIRWDWHLSADIVKPEDRLPTAHLTTSELFDAE
jgi:hypothetical protein